MDHTGKVTSHLSGLFYRTCNLLELGIKPIYVFDGIPPALKEIEIRRRTRIKDEATKKYEKALRERKTDEARTYAQMTSRLKDYMTEDSKRLLKTMGVPWIQAPSEGEAQAAHVVKNRDADYCASQDYDSLLFGAPRLLRNVTISGRRKLPRKKVYIEVIPEVIDLERVLNELSITHEQLIDIGILVGTDFNPDGVKGVGVKTGLKLIKKHGSLESALQELEQASFPAEPRRIREIFLNPRVTDNYRVFWREPKIGEAVDFLSGERDFSKDRVTKALERAVAGSKKASSRTTLEKWF